MYFLIIITTIIQSFAFQYPSSIFHQLNNSFHLTNPQFYTEQNLFIGLDHMLGKTYMSNNFQLIADNDWDNELPTLIYHGSRDICNDRTVK